MPRATEKNREQQLTKRFNEIEAKYTEDGIVMLGNASPDELRELAKLNKELIELRKQPEELTA